MLISRLNLPFTHLVRCNDVNILKLNTDVCHIFYNSLGQKASLQLPVNIICFFYCLRDSYPKLM